jgi:hypothetical protein
MPATGRLIATAGAPTNCGITYGEIDPRPMADLKFAKPTGMPRLLALRAGPLTTKFGDEPPKLRHKTTGTFNKLSARICGRAGSGEVASSRRLFRPPEPKGERAHLSLAELSDWTQVTAALEFAQHHYRTVCNLSSFGLTSK